MKTLTVTAARQNLGHWLKLAAKGEEIGVVVGANVIALRLVPITAADYATSEYGLAATEAEKADKRIAAAVRRERRAGTVQAFKGDWRELRG